MNNWISPYIDSQNAALQSVSLPAIERISDRLRTAISDDRQIFAFGNGGSAANASHFATDLGKGAADALGRRIRVLSLNDNCPWLSAIANDFKYEDVFWRQLQGYALPNDIALAISVSGNSPNVVKAVEWCKRNQVTTIALVGAGRGAIASIADEVVVVNENHFGRVEDVHMNICHILCYAFIEGRVKI